MRIKKIIIVGSLVVILCVIILTVALVFNGVIWFVYPERLGYTVKGIDVSRYQGEISWETISAQGITFAFVKATEGSSYSDPMFGSNIISSRRNGIYGGAYHFFSSESSGKTQAENFIRVVSEYDLDLPPVLDFEIARMEKDRDRDRDREIIIEDARTYLVEVEKHFGVKPIIYSTYSSYNAFLVDGFDEYQLWFRDLFREPKITGDRNWVFWQYCNRGRLAGIDERQKYVDLNVFYGDISEFKSYIDEFNLFLRIAEPIERR